jgi:hypothetical protein
MEYKLFGDTIYARFDRGEELLSGLVYICKKENVLSAVFSGIGACSEAIVSTYIPEKDEFLEHKIGGMLEIVSLNGNISSDDENNLFEHTHALFSYLDESGKPSVIGGHLKKATILYTGEIEIRPIKNGVIKRQKDKFSEITVWKF